ncbi:hypothetical protein BZG36_01125 [Bifiguratus adelaidae]|uniref:Uncharacterized protein n=1 Tax=Bifiguratus adelaidae TaxID=1938954 RepID=A0A261Y611_9FUNG|nr:hypothetical protein BZG36_01125 [Bifiguratus adelaidae]
MSLTRRANRKSPPRIVILVDRQELLEGSDTRDHAGANRIDDTQLAVFRLLLYFYNRVDHRVTWGWKLFDSREETVLPPPSNELHDLSTASFQRFEEQLRACIRTGDSQGSVDHGRLDANLHPFQFVTSPFQKIRTNLIQLLSDFPLHHHLVSQTATPTKHRRTPRAHGTGESITPVSIKNYVYIFTKLPSSHADLAMWMSGRVGSMQTFLTYEGAKMQCLGLLERVWQGLVMKGIWEECAELRVSVNVVDSSSLSRYSTLDAAEERIDRVILEQFQSILHALGGKTIPRHLLSISQDRLGGNSIDTLLRSFRNEKIDLTFGMMIRSTQKGSMIQRIVQVQRVHEPGKSVSKAHQILLLLTDEGRQDHPLAEVVLKSLVKYGLDDVPNSLFHTLKSIRILRVVDPWFVNVSMYNDDETTSDKQSFSISMRPLQNDDQKEQESACFQTALRLCRQVMRKNQSFLVELVPDEIYPAIESPTIAILQPIMYGILSLRILKPLDVCIRLSSFVSRSQPSLSANSNIYLSYSTLGTLLTSPQHLNAIYHDTMPGHEDVCPVDDALLDTDLPEQFFEILETQEQKESSVSTLNVATAQHSFFDLEAAPVEQGVYEEEASAADIPTTLSQVVEQCLKMYWRTLYGGKTLFSFAKDLATIMEAFLKSCHDSSESSHDLVAQLRKNVLLNVHALDKRHQHVIGNHINAYLDDSSSEPGSVLKGDSAITDDEAEQLESILAQMKQSNGVKVKDVLKGLRTTEMQMQVIVLLQCLALCRKYPSNVADLGAEGADAPSQTQQHQRSNVRRPARKISPTERDLTRSTIDFFDHLSILDTIGSDISGLFGHGDKSKHNTATLHKSESNATLIAITHPENIRNFFDNVIAFTFKTRVSGKLLDKLRQKCGWEEEFHRDEPPFIPPPKRTIETPIELPTKKPRLRPSGMYISSKILKREVEVTRKLADGLKANLSNKG